MKESQFGFRESNVSNFNANDEIQSNFSSNFNVNDDMQSNLSSNFDNK